MICLNCNQSIKDGSFFCQYCGTRQQDSVISLTTEATKSNTEVAHHRGRRKKLGWLIIAAIVAILVIGIILINNYHVCDWCDKKYIGAAYYEAWDYEEIMCEDCAKNYYRGLNYKSYKVQ